MPEKVVAKKKAARVTPEKSGAAIPSRKNLPVRERAGSPNTTPAPLRSVTKKKVTYSPTYKTTAPQGRKGLVTKLDVQRVKRLEELVANLDIQRIQGGFKHGQVHLQMSQKAFAEMTGALKLLVE